MGKLNIAHHKSYHPYRRDNIDRVRRDEEEAKLKEQAEEGRMRLAPTTNGHINFFEDLEQSSVVAAIKSTVRRRRQWLPLRRRRVSRLHRARRILKPWYSEKGKREAGTMEELPEDKRKRDERRKSSHDPLTSITKQLASRPGHLLRHTHLLPVRPTLSNYLRLEVHPAPALKDPTQARLSRESSERARAQALIEKKRREKGSRGSRDRDAGYSDVFNRDAVNSAHRDRDRDRGDRRWGGGYASKGNRSSWDRDRDNGRGREGSTSGVGK
ncbi:hypothetical protein FA13DRAFT_1865101 [Coprinellus micaceus]|uniref:CBF1-interacting co-repressor CIR N-terminal domain-containing protein n=1 Tax=Coprinellus micaceus TaxID=71717 RepID=A0A4Y7T4Y0_COPMI|nr:hypothetical protein FA13DRAFT_1865101 [Coprinellus micaceus]